MAAKSRVTATQLGVLRLLASAENGWMSSEAVGMHFWPNARGRADFRGPSGPAAVAARYLSRVEHRTGWVMRVWEKVTGTSASAYQITATGKVVVAANAEEWFVYIVLTRVGTYYTGIALDPDDRFLQHAAGEDVRRIRGGRGLDGDRLSRSRPGPRRARRPRRESPRPRPAAPRGHSPGR